jgi:GNAT superfamily N-acetyltransferase
MAETADEAAFLGIHEWRREQYLVSTDKRRLDLAVIHGFLTASYWSPGIPLETVQRAIAHSLAFGVYDGDQQIGMARVISDYTTFAYVADVFILDAYRGQGLGLWLMECVIAHPHLQGLRRWTLFTRDAHGLYEKVGFKRSEVPDRLMERAFPNIYTA